MCLFLSTSKDALKICHIWAIWKQPQIYLGQSIKLQKHLQSYRRHHSKGGQASVKMLSAMNFPIKEDNFPALYPQVYGAEKYSGL